MTEVVIAQGRTFDRLPSFDERSRSFDVSETLPAKKPRSYTWRCDANLDQGPDGACVGFGWSHEAAAKPKPRTGLDYNSAFAIYKEAQVIDEWPGETYEGTSVLAGAKIMQRHGYIGEYRWAFSTEDALAGISRHGPAVIGVNWHSGMFNTDAEGFIRPTGMVVGGHCVIVRGVSVKNGTVLIHNSWGPAWGGTKYGPGTALLSWDDFDTLLSAQGEACIPVQRF